MTRTTTRNDRRPARVGSAVAVVTAVGAASLLAAGSEQRLALGVEVAGLSAVALGVAIRRRGFRRLGLGVASVGVGVVFVAFRFGIVLPSEISERVVFLAGMVGAGVLAFGLLLLDSEWSRRTVTVGAAFLGVGALTAGALRETSTVTLFAAVAATMVAWDAAEQAVSLGTQLGRDADTATVALVHSAGSAVVGATAVGLALGATTVEPMDLPLAGLALLLGAVVVLALALYR